MSNQKRCPQCELVNFADAEVCKRCGASFDGLTKTSPVPRKNSNLIPCSECEHPVSTTALSCPSCGGIFKHPVEASQPKKEISEITKSIESGFFFLIALLFAGVALWNIYDPKMIVGGDAFNFIIAAGRGAGLAGIGIVFGLIGVTLRLR